MTRLWDAFSGAATSLSGPLPDPTTDAGWSGDHPKRVGFFTDTSVCIGCKACEVACKEWNDVPEDGYLLTGESYDNTSALGASTWRHVAFVEKPVTPAVDLGMPSFRGEDQATETGAEGNGEVTGDSTNDLVNLTLDPNVYIQGKVGTCDIRPGRRPRGPELTAFVEDYRRRAGEGSA